ncbi:MAG: hypothetical protein ACRD0W_18045 [Acidimicrobiales bacterium]
MAVSAERVTVGTSAVALNTAGPGGNTLTIRNGAAVINLGPSSVTNANGHTVAAAALLTVEIDSGDVLFAICATSSIVEVLRT